ncbi:hypothetical protein, partial [Amnibacterium sp.]|uniref:hypothetical protein n=1 Tax=Amnibacterium sp. TaxID=1872496 RepID=UPI002621AED2
MSSPDRLGAEGDGGTAPHTRAMGTSDGRVPLTLRLGVIGHRWLPSDEQVMRALGVVLDGVERALPPRSRSTDTELVVVSSIADGADRIVARAAMERGGRLEAVLPAPLEVFRRDFDPASATDFDDLLNAASTVVVVAQHVDDLAYRTAARAVVDRSDIVLAIWDGLPSRGPGGTAETYDYAVLQRKAVWWLEVTRTDEGVRISDRGAPELRPVLSREAREGLDLFNGRLGDERPRVSQPTELQAVFGRADRTAVRSQRRLRTLTIVNFALAVAAVTVQAAELAFHPSLPWLPALELVALVTIAVSLTVLRRGHYLDRWTASRYLAERIRAAIVLLAVGLIPATGRERVDLVADPDVEWATRALLEATWRTASAPPSADLKGVKRRLITGWLHDQVEYHRGTTRRYFAFDRIAFAVTLTLFVASVLLSLLSLLVALAGAESDADAIG